MIDGGRECHKFVPVLGGDGMKIAPPGDFFDQHLGEMCWIQGKLADHIGDHIVLSTEGIVLATFPGTESSYPCPPQSLKHLGGQEKEWTRCFLDDLKAFSINAGQWTMFVCSGHISDFV